jgi:hypothetical protein
MQAEANLPVPYYGCLDEQKQSVTFQIALVGCDGLVIGSDRRGLYGGSQAGQPHMLQTVSQEKYFKSENESIICFAAGSTTAINLARQIVAECDPAKLGSATESQWRDALYRTAAKPLGLASNTPVYLDDEVLVARKDRSDAFWLVLRKPTNLPLPVVQKYQNLCTGAKTTAIFLPSHLWNQEQTISELKKLALLTLSFAAVEEPSSIGPPFDIMTLDRSGNVTWSVYKPDKNFQACMAKLLADYEIAAPSYSGFPHQNKG